LTNALFIVVSDDIKWCRVNIEKRPNLEIVYTGIPAVDFALMTMANYSIVTQGSFGLWAAILAYSKMIKILPSNINTSRFAPQGFREQLENVEYVYSPLDLQE
jgi:hypothetical protein